MGLSEPPSSPPPPSRAAQNREEQAESLETGNKTQLLEEWDPLVSSTPHTPKERGSKVSLLHLYTETRIMLAESLFHAFIVKGENGTIQHPIIGR